MASRQLKKEDPESKKDIGSEDTAARLTFVRNLGQTAESLGPDRFRDEVIPDLKDLLEDEDEVQLALAEELGKPNITAWLGGPTHLPILLPTLESLAKSEDSNVRDKAVKSLLALEPVLSDDHFEKSFVELVIRLTESEWYSPKCSACGLMGVAFSRGSAGAKQRLLVDLKKCGADVTPMVRRSAATAIKNLAGLVDKSGVSVLIEVFKGLSYDDQDSVRLLAVDNCVAIASVVSDDEKNTIIKPIVLACGGDKSWRVRYMVANLFTQLVDSLGKQITQNDLVPVFIKLLKDTEPEVRTAAASKVSGVCKLLNRDTVIKDILPCVKQLSTDESAPVRSSLAGDVMGLAPLFGKEGTNEHLLELFLQLLKDETPDVRLNVIGKLSQVTQVLGLDQLSQHLLPAIVELAEDRQWRVRLAILEYIPLLAEQLGVEFFNLKLSSLTMSWFNDCVFSIREAATGNLKKLAKSFGVPWAKAHLLPKIIEQQKHRNYLYRTTTLSMISALSDVFPAVDIQSDFIPVLLGLAGDPIANIRINAVRTLDKLIPLLEIPFLQREVIPFLDRIVNDKDKDVSYFSSVALQTAKKR